MGVEKERVRALVAALRSEQWPQTTGRLGQLIPVEGSVTTMAYCCLGVATEVAIDNGCTNVTRGATPNAVPDSITYTYVTQSLLAYVQSTALPRPVVDWYGFNMEDPSLYIPPTLHEEIAGRFANWRSSGEAIQSTMFDLFEATTLNDRLRLTFLEIADCFEYTFLRADWDARHGS